MKKKYTFYLSLDMLKRLKKVCFELDIKLSRKLEELIEEYLKKSEKKK